MTKGNGMTKSLISVVFTLLVFTLAPAVFAGNVSTLQKPSLLFPPIIRFLKMFPRPPP